MRLRLVIAALCCLGLSGCLWPGHKPVVRPAIVGFPKNNNDGNTHPPRLVGHVAMVSAADKFVLLECDAFSAPAAGVAVKCLRDGAETAVLTVGSERRSTMVVADIVKGTPARGDEVFQ